MSVWLSASARADGLIVIHERPPHPRPAPYAFAPLEVRYHHVNVRVTDQVAVTEVDQTFFNANNQQLEGTYLFPIPKGAQMDRFAMDVNGEPVEAELLDAERARKIYEDIVRQARDPALLEYAGQGLFKVRMFPIEPRSEKRVQLKYTQLLREDSGLVEYTYPLNTEKFSAAPLKTVAIKVEIESERGIKSVYSPSHTVEVRQRGPHHATVGFEAKNVRPDTDFQLFFTRDQQSAVVGLNLLTFNPGETDGGYFLLLASPSAQMTADEIVQKDVVFVLDTSGSMAEGNKLDQAKAALRFCLKNLNEGDRFEVVRFSTETQPLFDGLVSTDEANLTKAEDFISGLKPIGGTAISDALRAALQPLKSRDGKERPYFVVFLTDGQPTVGETNEERIIAQAGAAMGDRPTRIFCFGLGTDVNTHLLDQLAERTRAASQYVLPSENIEVKVSNFYSKISQPVLADLKLRIGGGVRMEKTYPAHLPDLFKGEQLVVFGRYSGDGHAAITLDGTVNGRAQSFVYEGNFSSGDRKHEFIPRLWATRRVGFLLDQIRLNGETREVRDEVTALARRYGIVTPYTAYLITEDERGRGVPRRRQTLSMGGEDGEALAARDEAERAYKAAPAEKAGGGAVGGAQALDKLKNAGNVAAQLEANLAQTAPAASTAGGAALQRALEQQQARFIRGRTFYQNGEQWVDGLVSAKADAEAVQVKFGSDDYFALLAKHADAPQWLSVGRNVQLILDDAIYEIVD